MCISLLILNVLLRSKPVLSPLRVLVVLTRGL